MLKVATLAAVAMLSVCGVANAKTWYVHKQGNSCIKSPFSPQQFLDASAQNGRPMTPEVMPKNPGRDGSSVALKFNEEGAGGFILYTSIKDCNDIVKMGIADGSLVDPSELQ